jgi:hypothetical protein
MQGIATYLTARVTYSPTVSVHSSSGPNIAPALLGFSARGGSTAAGAVLDADDENESFDAEDENESSERIAQGRFEFLEFDDTSALSLLENQR